MNRVAYSQIETTTDEEMVVEGYAIIFDTLSDDLGGFKEIISPTALSQVDVTDVKCLINHDYNQIVGRTLANTLELTVDDKGLYFKCFLPNTSYARDIYENIKAGNVNQCAFLYTLLTTILQEHGQRLTVNMYKRLTRLMNY